MSKSHDPISKIDRAKRCMNRMKKCGIVWTISAILIFITGILLLIFFANNIQTDSWKKGLGITGIVFLLFGILAFCVAAFLIWAFCHLVDRQNQAMAKDGTKQKYHEGTTFSDNLYPRQPGYDKLQGSPHHMAGGYPAGSEMPTAPELTEHVGPDAIVIESNTKF